MPAFITALAPFPIGSLLAFAPFPASLIPALVRLLFVSILTFLLAPLSLSAIPLPVCGRIRSDKHNKAEQKCQTNSNQNISYGLHMQILSFSRL